MFSLRHAAARLLTSRSVSIVSRPRTITSFAPVLIRQSRIAAPLQSQRRWATNEAEAKTDAEEVPVSQMQPTAQEEVENAIHEDAAATKSTAPESAEMEAADSRTAESAAYENTSQDGGFAPSDARDSQSTYAGRGRVPMREPAEPKPNVYVGNLFFDVTENDLQKEFARFGNIKSVRLIRDPRGLSKGFGYIEFENVEQAEASIRDMNQQLFEGRRLNVSYAHSSGPTRPADGNAEHRPVNPPSKTLFIGNMSFEMTDKDLNNLFRGIRNVIDVRVAIDRRTGQPRGFAHADFIDIKSAMEAMKVLAGKQTYGRSLRVDYSFGPSAAPRNTPR